MLDSKPVMSSLSLSLSLEAEYNCKGLETAVITNYKDFNKESSGIGGITFVSAKQRAARIKT